MYKRQVKKALHTDSLTIAREMRDRYMDSDEHFWEIALAKKTGKTVQESPKMCRYRTARRRAVAVGFDFKPFPSLLNDEPIESMIERMQMLKSDEITEIDTQAKFDWPLGSSSPKVATRLPPRHFALTIISHLSPLTK